MTFRVRGGFAYSLHIRIGMSLMSAYVNGTFCRIIHHCQIWAELLERLETRLCVPLLWWQIKTFFKLSSCYTSRQENEHWESISKTCQTWRIFEGWILEKFICINSCFNFGPIKLHEFRCNNSISLLSWLQFFEGHIVTSRCDIICLSNM